MRVEITIDCDNAAFGDTDTERLTELATILVRLANELYGANVPDKLRDTNGNTVGTVSVTTN